MSTEQTRALIEKMKKDDQFRDKVLAIESIENRIEFVGKEGFSCNIEEFRELLEELEREMVSSMCGFCAPRDLPDKPVG